MRSMRKLAVGVSLVLSATAIPFIAATPAHATKAQCVDYLKRANYVIGPKVKDACTKGASDNFATRQVCFPVLVKAGVKNTHAAEACAYAYP